MRHRLVGLLVLVLVSVSAALVGASPAYAAPFSDNFNRADSTDLGASWSEVIGTDLEISANAVTNPQASSTFALALFATGNRVTAKVSSVTGANASVSLVLAHLTLNDTVLVKAYDSDGNGSLDHIAVSREINGAIVADRAVTPFAAGIMQATLVGKQLRVTVGDQGAPVPFNSELFLFADAPAGTGVGLGASTGATLDDFSSSVYVATPTSTTLTYEPTTVYEGDAVTLTAQVGGSGGPVGSVEFTVGGVTSAPVTVTSGQAQQVVGSLPLGPTPVSARFIPTDGVAYAESIDTEEVTVLERSHPTITAALSSDFPATSFGWYRSTVFVDYTCIPDGSPLAAPCPTGDNIAEEGENRTRTHTITAEDGGTGSVTVTVDIDLTAPNVELKGILDAPYLEDPRKTAKCVGSDALSGVGSCVVNTFKLGGGKVRVEALATDKAGNQAVDETVVRTATSGILKAAYTKGAYEVQAGKKYTVAVLGKKGGGKIFLVGVGDVVVNDAFKRKNGRWELKVKIPANLSAGRSVVKYRKGGKTYTLPIIVRR